MERIEKFNTAWFVPTYDCNNKCVWCYAASNESGNSGKTMKEEHENPLMDLLKSIGIQHVILIGGEPTIHKRLPELVGEFTKRDIRPGLVTNGRKLKNRDYVRALKDNGLKYTCFSIEGPNPELQDRTTGVKGSFYEEVTGIKNSAKEGIKTSTNTTISRLNVDQLEPMVDFLSTLDIELATFNICGVCLGSEDNSTYSISPLEGAEAYVKAYEHSKKVGLKVRLVTPAPFCVFDKEVLEEIVADNAITGACHILEGKNFVMDYNGDILPCTHFAGLPFFNVFQDGEIMSRERFLDVYNDSEGKSSKFRHDMRYYPSKNCGDNSCPDKCTGGCPLFWTKYDPAEIIRGFNDGNTKEQ